MEIKERTVRAAGEDPRLRCAVERLQEAGYTEASEAAVTLCPPPWDEERLAREAERLPPGGLLVTGRRFPSVWAAAERRGGSALCLAEDDGYRRINGMATAEGVFAEAARLSPRMLAGEVTAVLGYGFCGRAVALLFRAAGCRVPVYTRPASRARAVREGFAPLELGALKNCSLVINTVPEPDFLALFLPRFAPGTLFLQVASGAIPGEEALTAAGVRCVSLPGLPGKYAPETEGMTIAALVLRAAGDPFRRAK